MADVADTMPAATLQEQVDAQASHGKFGTFGGVFTPTLLTILGVIMYLRLGSVVGNAGLLGTWIIISIACGITICTGLSMSSITTNIRIGAGGAFSIIAQSLGLEVGGSIGVPLYLAQALAVVMYIFGFRDGWLSIFPSHPAILIDLITFLILFGIAFISANLAFRIQYVILAIIIASLLSILATVVTNDQWYQPQLWGTFEGFPETGFRGTDFWFVWALFFPAATGVMAGANMSGELKNPRRNIPVGTMAALILSTIIYFILAYWLSRVAPPEELVRNYNVMLERSLWEPIMLAGLLGATFSSGLASLVGAPRILFALGQHDIMPLSRWFSAQTAGGEPRNALWVSGGIALVGLLLRDLNAIAPLITMFFLITYAMVNLVVLIEQSLGLLSFRPIFRIPRLVPLLGTIGCLFAMFIVNPVFSLVAIVIVLGIYGVLLRRHLNAPFGDVRSGLFVSLAEWAAKRVSDLPDMQERAWKPNLLVPVEDTQELRGTFQFIRNLTQPRGSVKLLGLMQGTDVDAHLMRRLPELTRDFREQGTFATWTFMDGTGFGPGLMAGVQALSGSVLRPNTLFMHLPDAGDTEREEALRYVIDKARDHQLGILLFADHPKARLGRRNTVNVWVRDQSDAGWRLSMQLGNLDLAILTAYQLKQNWGGHINLITAVRDADQVDSAKVYLRNLVDLARLPDAIVHVEHRPFEAYVRQAPPADLTIFGMPRDFDFDWARRMVRQTRTACLFVRDSGVENALA